MARCLLCDYPDAKVQNRGLDSWYVECPSCGVVHFHGHFTAGIGVHGPELLFQYRATRHLVAGRAAERRVRRQGDLHLTDETWHELVGKAPTTFPTQVDRFLENLAAASSEGGLMTSLSSIKDAPLAFAQARDGLVARLEELQDMGYVRYQGKREDRLNDLGFVLTYSGWERVRDLEVQAAHVPGVEVPQAVVAGLAAEVRAALAASQTLIAAHGPSQGIDRLHTALHAYVRGSCQQAGLPVEPDASLMRLARLLRERHAAFAADTGLPQEPKVLLDRMASVLDVLNAARNRTEGAHPNPPLPEPEANLALNAARTVFLYLHSRLSTQPPRPPTW